MAPVDREAILEEEVIILRNSGEIPEIALHTTLYYLEEDAEGPKIRLLDEELDMLYDAALARAREIVLRDLDPANRDLGIYRGLARSIVNWNRLQDFSRRINRFCKGFDETVSEALLQFLQTECKDCGRNIRSSVINCTADEICAFCAELHLDVKILPEGWACLCPPE